MLEVICRRKPFKCLSKVEQTPEESRIGVPKGKDKLLFNASRVEDFIEVEIFTNQNMSLPHSNSDEMKNQTQELMEND